MHGQAFQGGGGASKRSHGRVSGQKSVAVRLEQLIDVDEVGAPPGAHHDTEAQIS